MTPRGTTSTRRPGDESVRTATGRGWSEWFDVLDRAGAADWDHKEVVAHLQRHYRKADAWWRQTIAVEYERAQGKRVIGQTADVGFQVGVQRSVDASVATVWRTITSRPDLWLGSDPPVRVEAGAAYRVTRTKDTPAARGEFRVVRPRDRLRMTWQPRGWDEPATVQLTLSRAGSGKTAVRAHVEQLPDARARDAMRDHWRSALDRIVAAAA